MKRQRCGGQVVAGGAAKKVHGSKLRKHYGEDFDLKEEHLAGVGLPEQIYYKDHRGQAASELEELPKVISLRVVTGADEVRQFLRDYHSMVCGFNEGTPAGRDFARDSRGWKAPQQYFALHGHNRGSVVSCTHVVYVQQTTDYVAMLAIAMSASARSCAILCIHVMPSCRGPLKLPERMWTKAREMVSTLARRRKVDKVRFSLELAKCQSQQGAALWIGRLGWDGSEDAKRAAQAWHEGKKDVPGTFICSFELKL